MPPGDAAQAVQKSAFPGAYADRIPGAQRLMTALSGIEVNIGTSTTCTTSVANGDVGAVIERAKSLIGTPYDFGGGTMDGPGAYSIDCSAFVAFAWTAAGYRDLPRVTQTQFDYLAPYPVAVADIQPGDLIYEAWGRTGSMGSPNGISHVTMYIGNGQVIEASNSAGRVKISSTRFNSAAFVGIRRVPATTTTDQP